MPYVISKGGTFGVTERLYATEDGEKMILIRWGPLGWLTPVRDRDCQVLKSSYEIEAAAEAREWLAKVEREEGKHGT